MTATSFKKITLLAPGSATDWGNGLNNGPLTDLDTCLGGILSKTLTNADVALTVAESKNPIVRLTGTLSGAVKITTTNQGFTIIENATTGSYAVTFINAATYGGATIGSAVTIPQGHKSVVVSDTTNGCRVLGTSYIEDLATAGVVKRSSTGVVTTDSITTAIVFCRDANGSTLQTGVQGDMSVPFDCTITGVSLLADYAGSMVLDIWKDSYGNFPPTVADTICSSAKPTLSTASKYVDTTLTGWTTSISAGDVIRISIDSVTSITRITLTITVNRF
jgi:hypothetical protein